LKRELLCTWRDCLSPRPISEIAAIDGDYNAKFNSHHRNANHDLLVWLDSDRRVDGKCRHGGQTPHPTPQNVRERNSSECQCLLATTLECICGRSERLWHDRTLAVGYAARRLAPERKRRLTPRKIFGASRLFASAATGPAGSLGHRPRESPVPVKDGALWIAPITARTVLSPSTSSARRLDRRADALRRSSARRSSDRCSTRSTCRYFQAPHRPR
jgi:hypothetical protein